MACDEINEYPPICVASTTSTPSNSNAPADAAATNLDYPESEAYHFKNIEWTPDGTTIIANSSDHHIRSYILPPDLLETDTPHHLSPFSTLPSAEPTYATAIYPFYNLQDSSTALFLSSVRDHPIRLSSAFSPVNVASYSLVNPTTEAFITPHSMVYPPSLGGTHFITGSDSLICLFDVSRTGSDGPVSWIPTIPSKRKQIVGGGVGMKGIVSAMAVNPSGDGILAAGTFTRHIGLYSSHGSGESLGTFNLARTKADRRIGGTGVTQLVWSPCGRYLYIAERKSDGVLVYDIRVTGQMLGYLQGRNALSNQRMKIDIVSSGPDGSHEVWAGGKDGITRVWKNPIYSAGGQDPDMEFKMHDDAVTSTLFHPMGSVLATCSGQRHHPSDDLLSETAPLPRRVDNSLKVWSMPYLAPD
ncbi:hypothetical protein N7495_006490 [Penicillium taxi]|uniref:uncharacterized protein n=1 Tax=Penicillium taxi TaxID=168475 RepID=UPI002545ABF7|nr:uncharacterized protein N7495_006490 [Penicillium taxi]KAJ5894799.1 hypothetical protein N7495_006490 [Penicillium taxi]